MKILITGISKGLGLVTTSKLLKKGHDVYGLSRSKTKEVEVLENQYPKSLTWIPFDLKDTHNLKSKIKQEVLKNVSLDGFVNNAAYAYDDIITNVNFQDLNRMFTINVINPIMLTKLILRNFLLHRTKGSIVHISSISAHTGYKGLAMYASTKGAIEAFSKNCSREWGGIGIRSNCIVAGFMETEMSSQLTQHQKKRIYKRTSTKNAVSIDSVSSTIMFLLSEKSESITGQNIFVDNGTI
jgi:3-oxoacyl-[acyl-carrier protein] reductase